MANHHPIRAIGAAQARKISGRLRQHSELMARFEGEGMSREDASRKAFMLVKAGKKTEDKPMGN